MVKLYVGMRVKVKNELPLTRLDKEHKMANQQHLDILKHGVEAWNQWRREHSDVQPDFRGADLTRANLWGADLWEADLRGADLRGADLSVANLWGANLWGANLTGANLSQANLRETNLDR